MRAEVFRDRATELGGHDVSEAGVVRLGELSADKLSAP